ncbi:MAG TPA: phosphatidate cytidylyltransferase [Steroidobacteraceae bacterium]|jgi:phosphatidate cytidylyltransferase|nr:phosphatidate cytidylyltransferase [Steroidobacteraceae bacterium]
MLRLRILTASILACVLLAGLFMLESRWTILAVGAVWIAGAWEWTRFGGLSSIASRLAYCCAIALLLALAWYWSDDPSRLLALLASACAWWTAAFLWLITAPEWHRPRLVLFCGVPVLIPAFVALGRLVLASRGSVGGPQIVLWLVLLVIASDIGAFFVGRRFGRRKLAPRVSPGKTWEGALGGLLAVALVALCAAECFGLPAGPSIGFGCAVGIFSVIGDLTESMFKRSAGLKDSGVILPGHGGILDRIDSVTAAAPFYALGLFGSGVIR